MNISMIVLNSFTHDARVMKEAKTLCAHGHQVTVNALRAPGLPAQETVEEISVQRVRLRSREGIYVPLAAWVELVPKFAQAIRAQQPDVCHAHDLNALIPAYFAARLTGARLIYDAHELETGRNPGHRPPSPWKRWMWQPLEGLLIRQADAVITVSPSIAGELVRLYGISQPVLLRNCPELIALPPRGALRALLELPDDVQIVLYQGGLAKGRGLEPLVRAVARVPAAVLVMLGDGPLGDRLTVLVTELGIEGRVHLPGRVPWRDLLLYTRDANVGVSLIEDVCSSYYYSLPNKLFEYLTVGVPVLASDFPDMRQVVLGAGAGIVAGPADVEGIAAALRRLLADRSALAEMGRRARQAAVEQYNWSQESKVLLALYDRWQ